MLKLRFAPFAVIGLSAAIAFAQEPASDTAARSEAPKVATIARHAPIRRKHKPVVAATPIPVATPVAKKEGFWKRVFGAKKPATPTPKPATPKPKVATPMPKTVVKKKTATRTKTKQKTDETKPIENNTDTDKPKKTRVETTPPAEEKREPVKTDAITRPPTIKNTKTKSGGDKVQNFPPSTDTTDADAVEKQKYDQAKAKAIADPKIQDLRGKADLAPSEGESRKALREYNKAMFKRMKEIDPSIKDHVDRMEAAVMSRLGE